MKKKGFVISVFLLLGLSAVLVFGVRLSHAAEVVLICNKNVPDSSLDKNDVKNIFLGMKTQWSNGKKIVFVTLGGSEIHDAFLKEFVGKTSFQFVNFWRKQVFTGKGRPPKSFRDEAQMVDFISGTDNAIGYVSQVSVTDAVKKIDVK